MLQPIGDYVIIKVKEKEEKSTGGIVIPTNAKEKQTVGKVVAVGKGSYGENGIKIPMSVEKGDTIIYDKYSGINIEYKGKKFLALHEKDILAVVK